jgi:DNA-binding Xre family transcriptional regulator
VARLALQRALKKKRLSKRQLAKRLGIAYHNVFRMFHEDYDPRFSKLNVIAKAIGCRVRDLFED